MAVQATADRQATAAFRTVECRVAAENHGHGVEVTRVHESKVARLELLDLLDRQQCCETVHRLNLRRERFREKIQHGAPGTLVRRLVVAKTCQTQCLATAPREGMADAAV